MIKLSSKEIIRKIAVNVFYIAAIVAINWFIMWIAIEAPYHFCPGYIPLRVCANNIDGSVLLANIVGAIVLFRYKKWAPGATSIIISIMILIAGNGA